jgi:hypothetical protein
MIFHRLMVIIVLVYQINLIQEYNSFTAVGELVGLLHDLA